jgi:hypothetical protein
MKKILLHFSMAAAVMFLAVALGPSLHAQQADQYAAPATPQQQTTPEQATPEQQPEAATPQQQQNDAQMPSSGDTTMTHEAKTFSGRIAKENGELVLKDTVTKVSYKLDDQQKAKQYAGKQVKVNGKLDMNSNTIQVDSIEPQS